MLNVSKVSAQLCSSLSEVLRDARLKADLSLGEVAALSGLNRQAITFVERGDRKPTTETLAKLSLALGLLPSEVWKRAEEKIGVTDKKAASQTQLLKKKTVEKP